MSNKNAGGWEVDRYGKRFRRVGNVIEYELEYTHPVIPRNPEREAALRKQESEREAKRHTGRYCPFKTGMQLECLADCALYGKTACALSMKEEPPTKDTKEAYCPVYRKKCNETCALYFNGCGLVSIVKGLKAGKE